MAWERSRSEAASDISPFRQLARKYPLPAYPPAVRVPLRRAFRRAPGLAPRAHRLLGDVILRTRQALGSQADGTREAVRHAAAQHSGALARLAQLETEWRAELQGHG